MASAYAEDANKNAQEANVIGARIVDNLAKQNDQMKQVSNRTRNIDANVRTSQKLLKEMQRKEKIVNLLLYCLCIVFLASDGLCFWLYHHYKATKDSQ